jgi:RND family efflux transporter MFP subunit
MVGGIINFLDVNEGDYVKKGQVLARINQTSVKVTTDRLTLAYEKAQRDYDRVKALYNDKVVTLENLQNSKTGLDNAKLQLESAQFSQQYATIKAPGSGTIQSVLIHKNEMTQPGSPVLIIGSNKGGKVLKTNIADIDIVKVNMQDYCVIKFDVFPNIIFTGSVSKMNSIADRYTGTYEIEIAVKDKKNILKSGFIGKATIQSKIENAYLQIPIEALISADKMTGKINVLVDGEKQSVIIKIAKILGEKILILEGLSENTEVILN